MKFNLGTILAATMTATVAAAPTSEGTIITPRAQEWAVDGSHANFISLGKEDGLNRWRWQFGGATCDDFKKSLEVPEGGGNNYNCFDEDDKSFFEVNQVVGPAGDKSIVTAVKRVTRQPCCDLGLPDWGMDRCLQEATDEDANKQCN